MQLTTSDEQQGERLDVVVAKALPRLSRAFIQKLCDQGKVQVNSKAGKAGYKVKAGDDVVVDYDESELEAIPAIKLPVLYEDDDVVVINKPVGVLTHTQGKFNREATVATFLRGKVSEELGGERAGIVHRLDRATSGVMIGAKNSKALSTLQKQFAQRKTRKIYLAIVEGHLEQQEAIIDMPIERNPKAP
ncbi:MAG TPA: RluA family pseudouridine synthase, partial [Candidatus Saccharimonadales bacterium]|nr:RluA family pseudouridine synthase [Candidatus Saccharimonadales bacterium]